MNVQNSREKYKFVPQDYKIRNKMARTKQAITLLMLLILLSGCLGGRTTNNSEQAGADTLYDHVNSLLCHNQMSEATAFAEALPPTTDSYVLRAYLSLYASDSASICALLDSAEIPSWQHESNHRLQYKRLVMAARILASQSVGNYNQANLLAQQAIDLCEHDSTIGSFSESQNLMGMIYFHKGKIVESAKAYRASMESVANERNCMAELEAYRGMAALFHKWSRSKMELEYMRKAMAIVASGEDIDVFTASTTAHMAGMAFEANNEPDSALYCYRQAYQVAITSGMVVYAEALNTDILRMLKGGEQLAHGTARNSGESNRELRSLIQEQDREMRQMHDNLRSSLTHEARFNKGIVWTCLALVAAMMGVVVYLKRSQAQNRNELQRSESRIREIEMALSNQKINAFLAEQNTGRFMEHFAGKYPYFVPKLKNRNEKLTKQDLILCALIALGESNETIQEIRHISKESLWAARYRLRSKLKLEHDQRLEDFLRQTLISC